MAITYRAWVPSITGKLSFTQIGKIGIPKALRAECSLYNDVWRFDCAEIRTKKLDDSIFQLRSREARKRHKNVVFALKANSKKVGDNYPFLKGELYCFIGTFTPSDVKNGKHWDVAPAFTVGFVLARSGKLTLTKMNIGKRLVHAVSQDTTKATNYLFKQSYFFLKDMVHRHRHHNPSDDTFIDCSIGKVGYGKHIAYQLAKRLIRRPIQNDPNSYQSALGILAYLKSYQQISSSTQEYSKANFEAIQQSLKAESVAVVNRMSNRKWIGAAGISVYTFILSKASFWDAGLCLIGGGDVGLKQSSSIVGLILLLFLTAHVSSILNLSLIHI